MNINTRSKETNIEIPSMTLRERTWKYIQRLQGNERKNMLNDSKVMNMSTCSMTPR